MKLGTINWIAVLICIVAALAVGFVWFGPLFGTRWMELVGLTEEQAAAAGFRPMIIAAIGTAMGCLLITGLLETSGQRGAAAGAKWGAVLWLLLLLPTGFIGDAFSQIPLELSAIEAGELLVSILIQGAILGAMKK